MKSSDLNFFDLRLPTLQLQEILHNKVHKVRTTKTPLMFKLDSRKILVKFW